MTSFVVGTITLEDVEVLNISRHGFWVAIKRRGYFLSFQDYPQFAQATIAQILQVELLSHDHLYRPELDVDLTVEILEKSENYPLIYN